MRKVRPREGPASQSQCVLFYETYFEERCAKSNQYEHITSLSSWTSQSMILMQGLDGALTPPFKFPCVFNTLVLHAWPTSWKTLLQTRRDYPHGIISADIISVDFWLQCSPFERTPNSGLTEHWIATKFRTLGLCWTWLNSQNKLSPQSMLLSVTHWSSERWNRFQSVPPPQAFPYDNRSLDPSSHPGPH